MWDLLQIQKDKADRWEFYNSDGSINVKKVLTSRDFYEKELQYHE